MLSTPSLGITALRFIVDHQIVFATFNSLSRDHLQSHFRGFHKKMGFQLPLSGSLKLCRWTNASTWCFQLPLSGSLDVQGVRDDGSYWVTFQLPLSGSLDNRVYSVKATIKYSLSTPSLGITEVKGTGCCFGKWVTELSTPSLGITRATTSGRNHQLLQTFNSLSRDHGIR